ncbi:hypothetical protein DYD21_19380 [Rhodohalobacter sp. SW132]|uniref:pyridoxamine 5'-phosphate oxidase family protein n=1 Tax=Rhodohalobacter sp. SW132 TaxID=2293433 RepID=UPI000E23C905|nr:pyridoxamine 5'-phosphate oxidase family protein [Rhodohalobacter sp. SW132]REL24144.1 hypothetical protein DYD21_19380 [Rhodohalobacter sp. SW132]
MPIRSTQSPDDILKQLNDDFIKAGKVEGHPFRIFNLSSVKTGGRSADSRMVVLRAFRAGWEFEFYTDFRSPKVQQIQKFPNISALFWDAENGLQVRVDAKTEVHYRNRVADDRWEDVPAHSRKEYAAVIPPGQKLNGPEQGHQWENEKDNTNFAVIICRAYQVRVLQLTKDGHLAVKSQRLNSEEEWQSEWIAP